MKTLQHFHTTRIEFFFLLGLFFLIGCGIYTDISVTTDKSADYSTYKTFAWLPDDYDTANSPYNNEIIRSNLKNYFGQNLSSRGFRFNIDTPDVLMQIVIANKNSQKEI